MIVVEGMDGSGKTGLIRRLAREMQIPVHERASTSVGGPVEDLYEWAKKDVLTWHHQPFSLYDRHPFVSEYVYGPITRGWMDPRFHTPEARELIKRFTYNSVIIFCDPGMSEVSDNVRRNKQMSGVVDNDQALFYTYRSIFTLWPTPLRVGRWDYTSPVADRAFDQLKTLIQAQRVAHERMVR